MEETGHAEARGRSSDSDRQRKEGGDMGQCTRKGKEGKEIRAQTVAKEPRKAEACVCMREGVSQ